MKDTQSGQSGRIGPNAVLQLLPVLEAAGGAALRDELLQAAGLNEPPSDTGLMDEGPAAAMHRALRARLPGRAPDLLREAGARTGDYILAHRIPGPAQKVLKLLPPALAAPVLAKAIEKNSWTFAGSGEFRVISTRPLVFELTDNPLIRGESAPHPICGWHEAVFDTLFQTLVDKRLRTRETKCTASGSGVCRFEITRD
ncbi:bacteriochlorophyll 4-vinyl reductase [Rhodovulum adriaticum]|uniref:Divinyl protochlorophyllide a 8-vinyl-reductase n=1 Tax=Rhodovulum adriaticum TaxID=35804 RepID=A0A4R2NLE9_RHOAD|nr:bacteriochlorophyll 4-vinyl reductase [Rhodovulum adriaticum]MBK1636021.1 bacteriochlorophyll 4-vinyl reductase [Rhodovulum adriaticum]TCP22453.1 divinyl protochlorophyllide a 8-vinyl-reductase [Rhodovulum adriaticum]